MTVYNRSVVPIKVQLCSGGSCNPDVTLPAAQSDQDPNPAHTNMVGGQTVDATITYQLKGGDSTIAASAVNPFGDEPYIECQGEPGRPGERISLVEGEVQKRLDQTYPFIASRKADTVNKQLVLELFLPFA